MINFYGNMWKGRSHVLAPLTSVLKFKGKNFASKWTAECEKSFDSIKAIISQETLLHYPDPNKPFHIETDASDLQLGSVILQDNQPVAFYSRKLTTAQQRYPTIDKEMLSIVKTFQEFRSILWGAEVHVYTDHKNLTQTNLTSQRILTWRMLLEEFAPLFHYKPGTENVVADTLSCYPMLDRGKKQIMSDDSIDLHFQDLMINYPTDVFHFPLNFQELHEAQTNDPTCQRLVEDDRYERHEFQGVELIARQDDNQQWRIVVPEATIKPMITWYHSVMGHCRADRLMQTI